MPFQSGKQRKYLWANEPAIAKRWEKYPKGYNTGGVSHLFRSKEDRVGFNAGSWRGNPGTDSRKEVRDAWKDFLGYRKKGGDKNWQKYMPIWIGANLAHGGYVRPEEDGVLGLADGGRIGFPGGGGTEGGYQDDWSTGAETTDTSSDDDHGAGDPNQFDMTPPTKDPTPDNSDGDARSKYLATQYLDPVKKKQTYVAPRSGKTIESNLATKKLGIKYSGSGPEEDSGLVKALKFIGTAAAVVGTGGTILGLGDLGIVKIASKINTVNKLTDNAVTAFNIINNTDFTKTELFNKIQTDAKNRKKMNYEWDKDPSGLDYGKDLVDKPVIKDTDNGQTDGRTDIQTEGQKIALKRKQEQDWASYLAQLRQEELNRKKQAYLKNYRQSYMSAKGGRVPGYNTGGLSNLFRLKTA